VAAKKDTGRIIKGKGQSDRLSAHKSLTGGPAEMFHLLAREHDSSVKKAAANIKEILAVKHPKYEFRIRSRLYKTEINGRLNTVDNRLGVEQFINGFILPESGLLEIKDKNDNWRLILLGEAKYQGRDFESFANGWRDESVIKQGKFTMTAGNVIERGFKNIVEVQNYMMGEMHFPYVLLAYGSNFITEEMILDWPGDKSSKPQKVKFLPTDGSLNRIDRMTAGTYGMPINTNHCRAIILKDGRILRPISYYAQPTKFPTEQIMKIFLDISLTSIEVLKENNQLLDEDE